DTRRFTVAGTTNELPGYGLFYSTDAGVTWTEATAFRPSISTVPNTAGVSTFGPANITLGSAVANGSEIQLPRGDDNAQQSSPNQLIGLDNVSVSILTPAFSSLTASPSVTYGATSVTLSGKLSATGPVYPANGETVSVTINGNAQTTTINDATGDF